MTTFGMTRDDVLALLGEHVRSDVLFKHCLATEAIMRALAARLGEDEDTWGLIGLIHDVDFDETKDDAKRHTLVAAEWLRARGIPEEYVQAIISHSNAEPGKVRETMLEHALSAAETITGLIVAAALVRPERTLASVEARSLRKRMKEKAFARNVDRAAIMECELIGVPLDEFISLSLSAMQSISAQLGL
jgi:putative nucleotidyltransferase with HDIG domain